MIIAIDGPAGSGKSSTARAVAKRLGYLYMDTGAMYRTIGLAFLRQGIPITEEAAAPLLETLQLDIEPGEEGMRVWLDAEEVTGAIRTQEMGVMASQVSTLASVRTQLVALQRELAHAWVKKGGGVILDGRDIGTVVFPDADLKIFLIAAPEVRANRRLKDLQKVGEETTQERVLNEIQERDKQDQERELAPLKKAVDALELDTSLMNFDEQVSFVFNEVMERTRIR